MTTTETHLVLGLGESGYWAARLLLREGRGVTAVDASEDERVMRRARDLRSRGAEVHTAAVDLPDQTFAQAVVSPGIRSDHPWILRLVSDHVPIRAELEWASRHCRPSLLAVTGTNGKSTTVKLCVDALRRAGKSAEPGGNYGRCLSRLVVESTPLDWIVLEVSSFQLEWTETFRHGTMDAYSRLKFRLFENMTRHDDGIIGEHVAVPGGTRRFPPVPLKTFGLSSSADVRFERGCVYVRYRPGVPPIDISGTLFDNLVMGTAAAAAVAAVDACGVAPGLIAEATRHFKPLPHRMQLAAEIDGVAFVNDSKATTLSALRAALTMVDRPVRLIAGGLLKEKKLKPVKELLEKKTRRVYLIGQDGPALKEAWADAVECVDAGTLDEAVRLAWADACAGDVILLSPGTASFDQFENFEERGQRFLSLANAIRKGEMS